MPVAYNIHPAFTVDDETLLETDLTACHLLVMVGHGTFSYAVYDPAAHRFLALKAYTFQPRQLALADLQMIEEVFDVDKLLFTAFKSVLLSFDTGNSVLVPDKYFNPQLKKDYLHLASPERLQEAVLYDMMPGLQVVNVYGVDKDLLGFLRKEFATDITLHAQSALLQAYPLDLDYRFSDGIAFLEIQASRFTLTIYHGGVLQLQQHLVYATGLDIVYHLVNALRQLGINEQRAKVKLAGVMNSDSPVYQEIIKFIPRVEWAQRVPGLHYITKMQEIPGYYFHNLYALALCV